MITEKAPTHRAQQKREQILTAARRLFLQHGFADTSTEAIRIEAGVSKETLYRYYASKEELFVDVLGNLSALEAGLNAATVRVHDIVDGVAVDRIAERRDKAP